MVKRIASVGVICIVGLAGCGALCQNVRESLIDAPSAQVAAPAQRFGGFVEEGRSPLRLSGMDTGVMRPGGFAAYERALSGQKRSRTIFEKYLSSSAVKRQSGYHALSSESLMGRATSAASRIFVTRDDSGKGRLNTTYLLRALTSVAADSASTPYWRRSLAAPFSDFGSTVGNDAGMSLWHEFGPSVEQLMKSHAPRLVSRIEERVGHH